MRKILVVAALFAVAGCQPQGANNAGGASGAGANPQTDEQKTFYALGVTLARQIQVFDMSPEELEYVKAGLTAQVTGKEPVVDIQAFGPKLPELARTRSTARAEKEKVKSKTFLEEAAKESGAERTESGLIYKTLTEGTGAQPTASDIVKVNYRGTLPDGKEFDSSYKRNEPAQFPLNGVIKCWTEGVQKMKVGGKAKLVCPSDLAYGDRGTPGIPGGSALVFEVELLDVQKNEPPPAPPAPEGQPAAPAPQGQPAKK
ncbi:FKBP-type peptidyl-prolyl cis-trans isomerase FkpA precursor [Cystobacter fuscus DSM 2262]|uniref:Peptidyl-prolyl cis-trans isomerase n=1 Tax=Cystobacter fuscus (strain ATCC 25194 / DSM 2262 / NBRC 100088 / M29) TaxID=1242864 RepID=S9P5Q6_CYSF2|nr:FKBP-type peptidyl-prolyl cis-trans isomerase [Cystobacter fuscus]EPX59795.1 FKBP-type peptidyl-prolyl cis-trans isomerase FkpA precursor [Cystobacter fuscus DSM 2262]